MPQQADSPEPLTADPTPEGGELSNQIDRLLSDMQKATGEIDSMLAPPRGTPAPPDGAPTHPQ
ncbi:MAG: hypothetical protein IBJ11_07295, partial [Phycisphaerales bacterium]|nr:hypothetical protein [Phycisphaerales bacterium]